MNIFDVLKIATRNVIKRASETKIMKNSLLGILKYSLENNKMQRTSIDNPQ